VRDRFEELFFKAMNFFVEMLGVAQEAPKVPKRIVPPRSVVMSLKEPAITSNIIPFKRKNDGYGFTQDQGIVETILQINPSLEQFRQSAELKLLLNDIVANISLFHSWGKQSVKVRLQAFIKMLIGQLCVPHLMTLYGVGVGTGAAVSKVEEGNTVGPTDESSGSFVNRAVHILSEAFTLFNLCEESLLELGDDSCMDKRRFYLFIQLMAIKCTALLAHALTVREHAPSALEALSCHLLGVAEVTQCIRDSIKIVVNRLSNTLMSETASLPISECVDTLQIIVLDYFAWLRDNAEQLVRMCRREEIIKSVDGSVRAWLRGERYSSPGDILVLYQRKYREYLTRMPVPLQPYRATDLSQARKDLVRQRLLINNVEYIGGFAAGAGAVTGAGAPSGVLPARSDRLSALYVDRHSHKDNSNSNSNSKSNSFSGNDVLPELAPADNMCSIIRLEIKKVLAYIYEFEALQETKHRQGHEDINEVAVAPSIVGGGIRTIVVSINDEGVKPQEEETVYNKLDQSNSSSTSSNRNSSAGGSAGEAKVKVDSNRSSRSGSRADMISAPLKGSATYGTISTTLQSGKLQALMHQPHCNPQNLTWQNELLDTLVAYTILAASTTFAAGDAFLILNDLYGGDGLTLCPASGPRKPPSAGPPPVAAAASARGSTGTGAAGSGATGTGAAGTGATGTGAAGTGAAGTGGRPDTVIAITAAGIKVGLKERYSLFVSAEMERCTDMSRLKPLMKFECNTTTLLLLDMTTLHSAAVTQQPSTPTQSHSSKQDDCCRLLRTLVSNPELLCHRSVSIEPYMQG
jgi:hypothetical protein